MKKPIRSKPAHVRGVLLDADDLRRISQLIDETCATPLIPDPPRVAADRFKYDSIEELLEDREGTRIKELEIGSVLPHAEIRTTDLPRQGIEVRVSGEDAESVVLRTRLVDLLSERQRGWAAVLSSDTVLILLLGIAGAFWLWHLVIRPGGLVSLLLACMPFGIFGFAMQLRKFDARIYAFRRRDKPSFWKRNKDALLVNVLVALLTAALSIAGTLAVTQLK